MKTPKEWSKIANYNGHGIDYTIEQIQTEAYNQAVKDCAESATAYITQESVNGGKVAKVNSESILKNLKK